MGGRSCTSDEIQDLRREGSQSDMLYMCSRWGGISPGSLRGKRERGIAGEYCWVLDIQISGEEFRLGGRAKGDLEA